MQRLNRILGLLLLGLIPVAGCAPAPSITVESVQVVGELDGAAALVFNGTILNEHDQTLRLLEFDYTLSMHGRQVYQGRHAAEMTLIEGSKRTFTLPASYPFLKADYRGLGFLPDSSSWSISGTLVYLGEGVLAETFLDMGFRPTVGFSASGDLEWPSSMTAWNR